MKTTLGKLNPGAAGIIVGVAASGECAPDLARRFLEMGILEGARGSIIALRRNEADHVEVQLEATHE